MPQFKYTAKTKDGQSLSETVEAASRESLGASLRAKGLLPTSIKQKHGRGQSFSKLQAMFRHVSLLEKLTFINNLAVTLKAGLPVSRALGVLTRQMPNAHFREVIAQIAHNVEGGKTLSESMAAHPNLFSPIVVNMVRVGEQSGELDNTLEYLGKQIARDYNLIRRARGALIYPSVVFGVLLIIGYLMFTYVLPKITASFEGLDADLPVLTRVIIKTVDVFSNHSLLVLIGVVGAAAAFWFWQRTPAGRRSMHRVVLVTPVIGSVAKKINLARFTIVFSGLLRSGMPIVEALSVSGQTMSNIYYREAILESADKVRVGVDLVVALEKYPELFTPMVTQMIQVGEESGTMEKVLGEVANFYEAEVDDTMKNLSAIIEPLLVIVIGAVVGVLAIGLIMPIYNIGQSIQ